MSLGQLIEYHALHTAVRAARRIEELIVACAGMGDAAARRSAWRLFERKARGTAGSGVTGGPESETPKSLEEFKRQVSGE